MLYVRQKTSHRRQSRVNGGTSPRICTGGRQWCLFPQNSAHNVLNNAVCRLFILICTGYNVPHCRSADLRIFKRVKCRWFCRFFLRTWRVKRGCRRSTISWKKHIHFVEIFIVGITLCAIYVRQKTSHRRKSRVNGGRPPEFVLGGRQWCLFPQNSAHNVLNNAVCRLFILICTGYNVLHCV